MAKLVKQVTHLSSCKIFKDFLSNSTRSNPSNGFPSRRSTTTLNIGVQMYELNAYLIEWKCLTYYTVKINTWTDLTPYFMS